MSDDIANCGQAHLTAREKSDNGSIRTTILTLNNGAGADDGLGNTADARGTLVVVVTSLDAPHAAEFLVAWPFPLSDQAVKRRKC